MWTFSIWEEYVGYKVAFAYGEAMAEVRDASIDDDSSTEVLRAIPQWPPCRGGKVFEHYQRGFVYIEIELCITM